MRRLILVCCVLGLIGATPMPRRGPPTALPILPGTTENAPLVSAPGSAAADGITVYATGAVSAQATSANLTLNITSQTANITESSLAPVVDALVRVGANRSSLIVPPAVKGGPLNAVALSISMPHISSDIVNEGIQKLGTAFAGQPQWTLQYVAVRLNVTNCQSYIDDARSRAMRQGRTQAAKIAAIAGRKIDRVVAIAVNGETPVDASGACQSGFGISPNSPPQQISAYILARVSSALTMRFSMK